MSPNLPWLGQSIFKKFTNIDILAFFVAPKWWEEKVEIEGVGPPWRDSQRNSAPGRGPQVPNGATATHLVTKRCDLGSLGVPGPASTPLGLVWQSHNVPVWQSHRACGCRRAGGGRAVAPTQTPLVSTHPPKIAIPLLGGITFVIAIVVLLQVVTRTRFKTGVFPQPSWEERVIVWST